MVLQFEGKPLEDGVKPGASKSGYNLEHEISKSLDNIPNSWYHKWSDTHMFSSFSKKIIIPKSPGDFFVVIGSPIPDDKSQGLLEGTSFTMKPRPLFIECKSSRNPASYDFTLIPDHQLQAGLDLSKVGMPYYFVINRRIANKQVAFVLRPYVVAAIKDELMKHAERSLKWEWVAHFASCVFRKLPDDKTRWDMDWLTMETFLSFTYDASLEHIEKINDEEAFKIVQPLMWARHPEFIRAREVAKRHKCCQCGKRKVYGQELNEKGEGAPEKPRWVCKACSNIVTKA